MSKFIDIQRRTKDNLNLYRVINAFIFIHLYSLLIQSNSNDRFKKLNPGTSKNSENNENNLKFILDLSILPLFSEIIHLLIQIQNN